MKMLLTWHEAREHEVFGKSAGDPELEIRAQELGLPANRIRGYRELRVRARGHVELPLAQRLQRRFQRGQARLTTSRSFMSRDPDMLCHE